VSAPRRIFAVVVNWNGGELNHDCLDALVAEGIPPARIVFVDNASRDGSLASVRERFAPLEVIENAANLGFGEASNQGATRALELGADAVLFVNNDLVLEPGCLALLVAYLAELPRVGICGPRVLDRSDPTRLWCAGGFLTWRQNLSTLRGHLKRDAEPYRADLAVDYVPGCALLARREVPERVGGVDARYFAYMEDVDLCLRAKRLGYEVHLVGEASALHAYSHSTGGGYNARRKYMMGVNSVWFLRAHGGPLEWGRFLLFDVLPLPLLWLTGLANGRAGAVWAKGRGIVDGLRGRRVSRADAEPRAK